MITWKREPPPSVLLTPTVPPSRCANLRASDDPRPVPRKGFCTRVSMRTKSDNRVGRCSAAMPAPEFLGGDTAFGE